MHILHAITSRITISGAGRRHKHLAQDTDIPVTFWQSPVQEPDVDPRRCGRKQRSVAVAKVNRWKARMARIIKNKIHKKKGPSEAALRMMKMFEDAVRNCAYVSENERARLEHQANFAAIYTPEELEKVFSPSKRYLDIDWEEEYEKKRLAWKEARAQCVSARK